MYKLPKKVNHFFRRRNLNPFISQGTAYAFITSQNPEWTLSKININDSLSVPGRTLDSLYSNDSSIGYVLYNDQADQVTVIKGHTKGILLFNENSAIWIVHSIPHFPPKKSENNYFIRPPQCVFGQSMLCMSFNFEQLDQIGRQMLYTFPQIYDYYIPEKLKNLNSRVLDNLLSVINRKHVTQAPWTSVKQLITRGGELLLSISKFTDFHDDLYSGLMTQTLETDLLTETWNNGPGTLKSNCTSPWNVLNIQHIKFEAAELSFSVHNDHSKWAVSYQENSVNDLFYFDELEKVQVPKFLCIGDINRQLDQFKRAGGTICFINNTRIWEQYSSLVYDVEDCHKMKVNRIKYSKFKSNKTNENLIMLGKD